MLRVLKRKPCEKNIKKNSNFKDSSKVMNMTVSSENRNTKKGGVPGVLG